MSLSDVLASQLSSKILDLDEAWRTLIVDHRTYLIQTGTAITISEEILGQCGYNIDRFLRSQGRDPALRWIVLVINGLPSDIEFTIDMLNKTLYIPDADKVNNLYVQYTSKSSG